MAQAKKQNGIISFFKRNFAMLVIVACIVAIVAIVLTETTAKKVAPLPDVVIGGGGITNSSPELPGGDIIVDNEPVTFDLPLSEYTIAMDYTEGDDFVYSSTLNEWTTHRGIDFVAKGSKEVRAVADGKVESVTTDAEHGTKIVIDHGDGLKSIYASLAENPKVKKGDNVKKGDVIGEASDTGYLEFKCGPHVHFEMTKDGKHVCPKQYLNIQ